MHLALVGTQRETKRKPTVSGNDYFEKHSYGCGSTPMVPLWGRCTAHFRTYFSGDWDVHWGYGVLTYGHV